MRQTSPLRRRPTAWCAQSCLALLILLRLLLAGSPALAAPHLLEDLRYQMAVWAWPDAARVRVTLKDQGQGRLTAEVLGETKGFIRLISGNHRERLQTEMIWREGRLVPSVYREESWRQGQHALKEYRFDYPRARLELWEWHEGKGLEKKWQTDLSEQVYDPLSAFYNCRLKILGPNPGGGNQHHPGHSLSPPRSPGSASGSRNRRRPPSHGLLSQLGLRRFPGRGVRHGRCPAIAAPGLDHGLRRHRHRHFAAGKRHYARRTTGIIRVWAGCRPRQTKLSLIFGAVH